jgi:hypothetical protein
MGNYVTADVHDKKVFVSNFLVDGKVSLSLSLSFCLMTERAMQTSRATSGMSDFH